MADIAVATVAATNTVSSPVTVVSKKQPKKRINYALAGTLIASGLSYDEAAKQVGAKTGKVLQVGLHRKGVTIQQATSLPLTASRSVAVTAEITRNIVSEASAVLKDKFGAVLDRHADALSQVPAKRNLKHLAQVGQAMEPFVRMAKIVHGWGDESVSGLISIGVVEQLQRPGCGVDTPTGSAQEQLQNSTGAPSEQVIDVQSGTD